MTPGTRCPECDFALMYAGASEVNVSVQRPGRPERRLYNPDVIYCDRCGWFRFATADDHPVLPALRRNPSVEEERLSGRVETGLGDFHGLERREHGER